MFDLSKEAQKNFLIKRIATGNLKTNCYVIATNSNNCLIFDPGSNFEKIDDYINKNNLCPSHIFLTHGHYDHIGAVPNFQKNYPQIKTAISEADQECLSDGDKSLANLYGNYDQQPAKHDILITDNLILTIDNIEIRCFLTPGHTRGSACYLINNDTLLTGDTIFKNSVGRTDLYGGNEKSLLASIKKIYHLLQPSVEKPIQIFPGHWLSSTLHQELISNPHLKI